MRMRGARSFIVALGAICALIVAGGSSSAADGHEGVVSVSGRGEAIRVVVYAGFQRVRGRRALSCDDGERKLVDRMMEAGTTASFTSPEACVCFQSSASAFRRVDLTRPEWACAPRDEAGRLSGPIRIAVSIP
jgi:hypothetical protein